MKILTKSLVFTIAGLLLWGVTIYLFTIVAPWMAAVEPQSIPSPAKEDALNAKWVAVVNDHGIWKHWERGTVSQRSAYFAMHLGALVCSGVFAFVLMFRASKIHKAEQRSAHQSTTAP